MILMSIGVFGLVGGVYGGEESLLYSGGGAGAGVMMQFSLSQIK
jgi:hypothetical protein